MSFTILACSDIRAQKVNLELPYAAPPSSVDELRRGIEQTFRGEEEAMKRANGWTDTRACEPFTVNRLQKYDDDTQSWAEVNSLQMVQTYDQLYVFRKSTTKADIATERELPPPRKSPFFPYAYNSSPSTKNNITAGEPVGSTPGYGLHAAVLPATSSSSSPQIGYPHNRLTESVPAGMSMTTAAAHTPYRAPGAGARPRGSPFAARRGSAGHGGGGGGPVHVDGSLLVYRERTTPERIEYLFRFADEGRQGALGPRDYEAMFRAADIRFPSSVVYDLHQHFAHPTPGTGSGPRMAMDDFQRYASDFPVAVNIAYQRITNQEREEAIVAAQRETAQRVDGLQRQVKDLEDHLAAAQRELQRQADQKARLQEGLLELHRQRDPAYCQEEQQLLDKEVSVFKYRERLSQEEQDYERMAMERRRRAAQLATAESSPVPGTNGAAGGVYGYGNGGFEDGRYGPA